MGRASRGGRGTVPPSCGCTTRTTRKWSGPPAVNIGGQARKSAIGRLMRIPTVRGVIDRRILVNYHVDPGVLRRLLPALGSGPSGSAAPVWSGTA